MLLLTHDILTHDINLLIANQFVCVYAETYVLRIYAIMLPPSDFSVAHCLVIMSLFVACELFGAASILSSQTHLEA